MHPILMLLNATLGANVRRWASGLGTAGVLCAVLAVTGALLLSGPVSSGPVQADLGSWAQEGGPAVVPGGAPAVRSGDNTSDEVRLEDWEYTGKPISPAIVRTKKKVP
jgi:hypothetical protein